MKRYILLIAALSLLPRLSHAQSWTVTGHMASERHFPIIVPLNDGRVLIAGGTADPGFVIGLQTVEIHDPATGQTVPGAALPAPRFWSGVVKLRDGRVAVFGGATSVSAVGANTTFIYDPAANAWSTRAPMSTVRPKPFAELLPDGRVLVVGSDFFSGATAEIYDPVLDTWTPTSSPLNDHQFGASTTLADGRILIVGGQPESDPEIYNPATGTWSATSPTVSTYLVWGSLVRVPDGRIVSGGTFSTTVDIFDPATGTWSLGAPMPTITLASSGALLPDGRVLMAGGLEETGFRDVAITQIYDSLTDTWIAGPTMHELHGSAIATLPGGAIVVAGVISSEQLTSIEVLGSIQNEPPVASAGADVTGVSCGACPSLVTVDAGGSYDPEGSALTYIWSIGTTIVLTTTSPVAAVAVPIGATELTLTVRDWRGAKSTDTVVAVVTNVEDGYLATIASLHSDIGVLNSHIVALESSLGTCQASNGSAAAELQRVMDAIAKLNHGQQQAFYKALNGGK